jgi:hypothetical protein
MKSEFDSLFRALAEARRPQPPGLTVTVQTLPDVGQPPSPWEKMTR